MNWLNGKKTYLAAFGLFVLGVALIMRGFDEIGMYCILTAAGFVGLGDRANRHQAQILAAIEGVAQLAAEAKGKSSAAVVEDAVKEIRDALKPLPVAAVAANVAEGN